MTHAENFVEITDYVVWFKHLHAKSLIEKLNSLPAKGEVSLETDGVVGRWQRLANGNDGRPVFGIRPVGAMKSVWGDWFKNRKGEKVEILEVKLTDDYLAASSVSFSEWAGDEDEEAFRDL